MFDHRAYRRALGNFATGVTVVTAARPDGNGFVGITANSFNSVSLDPPLVLWSLDRRALSLPFFERAGYFVVNVLAADQVALSNRFAGRGQGDKFRDVSFRAGAGGAPVLSGCAASFQCRTCFTHEGGDHVIFMGEVLDFADHGRPGLVYHRGAYAVSERHPVTDAGSAPRVGAGFLDRHLGRLLALALASFQSRLDPILMRAGIDRARWQALCVLHDHAAGLSAEEVAIAGLLPAGAGTDWLEPLARAGLLDVVHQEGGVDLCRLTARGREFISPLLHAAGACEADALGSLSAADACRLKDLLQSLPRPVLASSQTCAFLLDGDRKD